ncbi:hypothetical protein [Streptomyces sp. SA15]|uniref:hypothetical protein n=1 Tax=Streptomyces sp. SA15 TaxID=934019 RepID=UPI00117EC36D|nr:hypothetical protein [Streptomyces sp. SA15]
MRVLAFLLVLATGAFTAIAVVENFSAGPDYAVEIFDNQIATLNAPGLFLSGVGLALIFCLGLAVLTAGPKRRHHAHEAVPVAYTSEQREADRAVSTQAVHRRRGWHIFGH